MTPKFFSQENNDHASEFKKCLPVNVNTSFVTLAPAIATVEEQRIKPLLGEALYERAAAYYADNETEADEEAQTVLDGLIEIIQMADVRLAYWDSFDQLAVMLSDTGISDKNAENRAYRYQSDALRANLERQGHSYINSMLEYCESNIEVLEEFEESEYYTERQDSLIRSMSEFDKIVSINHDFCIFARLREYIATTETMELRYRIGDTLADAMIADREASRFAPIYRAAMAFVAHWSMADAAPFLGLIITPSGVMMASESEASGTMTGTSKKNADEKAIERYVGRHREMAERYIGQLVTYCKANAETFPEIETIGTEEMHEHYAYTRDNDNKKSFMV